MSESSVMQYRTDGRMSIVADLHGEAGVRRAAQQAVELLDLAALALPAHPDSLALVPPPVAMEEEEAIRVVRRRTARSAPRCPLAPRRACRVVLASRALARRRNR